MSQVQDILNTKGFLGGIIGSKVTEDFPDRENKQYREDMNFCLGEPASCA